MLIGSICACRHFFAACRGHENGFDRAAIPKIILPRFGMKIAWRRRWRQVAGAVRIERLPNSERKSSAAPAQNLVRALQPFLSNCAQDMLGLL